MESRSKRLPASRSFPCNPQGNRSGKSHRESLGPLSNPLREPEPEPDENVKARLIDSSVLQSNPSTCRRVRLDERHKFRNDHPRPRLRLSSLGVHVHVTFKHLSRALK